MENILCIFRVKPPFLNSSSVAWTGPTDEFCPFYQPARMVSIASRRGGLYNLADPVQLQMSRKQGTLGI